MYNKIFYTFQRGLRTYKFNIYYSWEFESDSGYFWRCYITEVPDVIVYYYGGYDKWFDATQHTINHLKHLQNLSDLYIK